jgi:serine protease SohB
LEFLSEYGLFLAKAVTIVIASLVIIGAIISAGQKGKSQQSGQITVTHVSEELKELEQDIRKETLSKEAYKAYLKSQKEQQKQKAKANKKAAKKKTAENEGESEPDTEGSASGKEKRLFVVDFEGDVQASAVENLREEITAILSVAEPDDEVLVRLESAGGMVHTYGLAASQLKRIKQQNIKLNIAVDEVAASGGYMMACVADKILAAPFAIIGSIGVIGQLPNFNRLLKHNKVDFEQHTAGEFKRTLTMFGENTDKAREKFKQELEETHSLFKAFIAENRSSLDVNKVATGEHWYGTQALELGLVDEISTSDDFIVRWAKEHSVFKVKYEIKKPLSERLPISLAAAIQHAVLNVWQRGENQKLFK